MYLGKMIFDKPYYCCNISIFGRIWLETAGNFYELFLTLILYIGSQNALNGFCMS